MNQHTPDDQILEQAALYALGALEGEDRQQFEKLVEEGCATCRAVEEFQDVATKLGSFVTPVQPPPQLRQKLLDRIHEQELLQDSSPAERSRTVESPLPGFTFVHTGEAEWQEAGPGMWLKVLHSDPARDRMTALARMDPGCEYAPHRHAGAEELYVLEGTCNCGGRVLHVGDYHRAEAGSIHNETSTQDGCLMLVIFSPNNEMLEPTQA